MNYEVLENLNGATFVSGYHNFYGMPSEVLFDTAVRIEQVAFKKELRNPDTAIYRAYELLGAAVVAAQKEQNPVSTAATEL